ncbi:MAG TPA: phosphatidylglycerophosphatase A [Candidatus Cloacimonadota bacterium]|nr:phosphatidylglycerophosphatase A [Candidatus Cloacimonadota bacterium]HPT72769.1 phosphatidylglycerophosphatase A [Candidatus Cloacimonadota bacterium]
MKFNDISVTAASTLGVGLIPFAPGTFGSLLGILIWIILPKTWMGLGWAYYRPSNSFILGHRDMRVMFISLGITLVLSLIAVWVTGKAEKKLGHDSPKIVLDEVCGMFLSVLFLPRTWMLYIYAFLLFRALDITKPFPIKQIQKLPGGWGIVADDLAAGLITNLLLQLILHVRESFFFIL